VYVPVQMVIAVVPISVSGLGPGQAAQRVLYTEWADLAHGVGAGQATVDAYGLALFLGFLLPRVLIGVLSLRAASKEMVVPDDGDGVDAAPEVR